MPRVPRRFDDYNDDVDDDLLGDGGDDIIVGDDTTSATTRTTSNHRDPSTTPSHHQPQPPPPHQHQGGEEENDDQLIHHRAVHQIHLSSLRHNFAVIESAASKQQCNVIVVVKADGYGHGAVESALHLNYACGADAFAVATLEEGIALRRAFEEFYGGSGAGGVGAGAGVGAGVGVQPAAAPAGSRRGSWLTSASSGESFGGVGGVGAPTMTPAAATAAGGGAAALTAGHFVPPPPPARSPTPPPPRAAGAPQYGGGPGTGVAGMPQQLGPLSTVQGRQLQPPQQPPHSPQRKPRIVVLGPPVGYPRCYDAYLHHSIEATISGPEAARALLQWIRDVDGRRQREVERAATEWKERLVLTDDVVHMMMASAAAAPNSLGNTVGMKHKRHRLKEDEKKDDVGGAGCGNSSKGDAPTPSPPPELPTGEPSDERLGSGRFDDDDGDNGEGGNGVDISSAAAAAAPSPSPSPPPPSSAPQAQPPQTQHTQTQNRHTVVPSAATLTHVSGHELAREVREILLGQRMVVAAQAQAASATADASLPGGAAAAPPTTAAAAPARHDDKTDVGQATGRSIAATTTTTKKKENAPSMSSSSAAAPTIPGLANQPAAATASAGTTTTTAADAAASASPKPGTATQPQPQAQQQLLPHTQPPRQPFRGIEDVARQSRHRELREHRAAAAAAAAVAAATTDADGGSKQEGCAARANKASASPTAAASSAPAATMPTVNRKRLRWHALVDSGMGRLGFKTTTATATTKGDPGSNSGIGNGDNGNTTKQHQSSSKGDGGSRESKAKDDSLLFGDGTNGGGVGGNSGSGAGGTDQTVSIIKALHDAEVHDGAPIEFYGMCTHMADANSRSTYTHDQMDRFLVLLRRVRDAGISVPTVSTDNSSALLTTSLDHFDPSRILSHDTRGYVRTGGGIYGQRPDFTQLRAVSTLVASVKHVAVIRKGESVGYDRAYVADRDVRIATLTMGFADGYPRELGNGVGRVSIRGSVFPVAGNVCMDMMMVDLGPAEERDGPGWKVVVGDVAVLWGPDEADYGGDGGDGGAVVDGCGAGRHKDGLVRLADVAATLKTTQSALTCGLDKTRVQRQFV